jgi:hypothetical protein
MSFLRLNRLIKDYPRINLFMPSRAFVSRKGGLTLTRVTIRMHLLAALSV